MSQKTVEKLRAELAEVKAFAQQLLNAYGELASNVDWFIEPKLRERAVDLGLDPDERYKR